MQVTQQSETHIVGHRCLSTETNLYNVEKFNLEANNMDSYLLGEFEEEEENWPMDEVQNGIKCLVVQLTEQLQEKLQARYLSMPLIRRKPRRTGPYVV